MKRRAAVISVLSALVLLVSMMGGLTALAAPSSAVAGSVAILSSALAGKTHATKNAGGNTLTIQVSDNDLNFAVDTTQSFTTAGLTKAAANATQVLQVTTLPIADSNSDSFVNFSDVIIVGLSSASAEVDVSSNLSILSVDPNNGLVTIKNVTDNTSGITGVAESSSLLNVKLKYKSSAKQVTSTGVADGRLDTVTVKSSSNTTGFKIRLEETTPTSGIFRGTVTIGAATNTSPLTTVTEAALGVDFSGDGTLATTAITSTVNEVTSIYKTVTGVDLNGDGDATDTAVAVADINVALFPGSSTRPTLLVGSEDTVTVSYKDASPAQTVSDSLTVEEIAPTVTVSAPTHQTGTNAPVPSLIATVTDTGSGLASTAIKFEISGSVGDDGTTVTPTLTEAITGGYRATFRFSATQSEGDIKWRVTASDKAGNVGYSDATATTTCNPESSGGLTTSATCEAHSLTIDFSPPTVASAVTGNYWDTITSTEKSGTTGKNTSIKVTFSDSSVSLDADSVVRADFTVDGVAPEEAEWFKGTTASDQRLNVYLTVPAITSNSRPIVKLVGSVSDAAGNARTTGTATSTDGLPPTIAASTNVTLTKKTIAISVTADETLVSAPTVSIFSEKSTSAAHTPTAVATGTNEWTATQNITTPGRYNVTISGTDLSNNAGVTGTVGTITGFPTSKSITFEVDTAVAAPTFTHLGSSIANAKIQYAEPFFLTIDWSTEGAEYGMDANGGHVTSSIITDTDTHGKITLTQVLFDGVDVTASVSSTNNISFLYAINDITLGEHTIKAKGSDESGNAQTTFTSATFTIKVKELFKLNLKPGWNLVSIPNSASDPAIDSVFPSTSQVNTVLTHAPSDEDGPWLTAVRDTNGVFQGNLTSISSQRGYWVKAETFDTVKIDIPAQSGGSAALPPAIPVVIGWNLVPVTDLSGSKADDANLGINFGAYLKGLTVSRVYTFDTVANQYSLIDHTATTPPDPVVGSAYWAYVTKGDYLVP